MTYYIFRYWNITLLNLMQPYLSFLFAGLILLLLVTLITLKWKISIHAASIAGLAGGITALTLTAQPIINLQQIFLIIFFLLFGAERLPKLARSMGQAKGEFQEGLNDVVNIICLVLFVKSKTVKI